MCYLIVINFGQKIEKYVNVALKYGKKILGKMLRCTQSLKYISSQHLIMLQCHLHPVTLNDNNKYYRFYLGQIKQFYWPIV